MNVLPTGAQDARPYDLIAQELRKFDDGDSGLMVVIDKVNKALEGLQNTDKAWVDEMRAEISKLDIVFAYARAKFAKTSLPELPQGVRDAGDILDAVKAKMRVLLDQRGAVAGVGDV